MVHDVVSIGGSAGSLRALQLLLPHVPASSKLAILIVLHQHRRSTPRDLGEVLGRWAKLPTAMISDKDPILPGHVLVCPADYHLLVEADRTLTLSVDPPVQLARPSIDAFFESAAMALRERLVGILLSGASADGARGLAAIHDRGGRTGCQDPSTAEEPAMPTAGCSATTPDWIASPEELGAELARLSHE